jgi:hypothetical protein
MGSHLLRKSGTTSWELFDADFDKLGNVIEWDGDEGLGNLRGLYYRFPDADSIKCIYRTPMDEDPALQKSELQNKNATPLEKGFSSPSDATTATSPIVSLVHNENPTLSSTRAMDEYESNLLAQYIKASGGHITTILGGNRFRKEHHTS